MKVDTAKKILSKNGIQWNNVFDLTFVEQNTNNEVVLNAIKRIKHFIYSGH